MSFTLQQAVQRAKANQLSPYQIRVNEMQVRINTLTATVAKLERELAVERSRIAVEIESYIPLYKLADIVSEKTGIEIAAMQSDQRGKHTSRARHLLMYLAAKHTKLSLPGIGRFLNKDHTSVIHGRRRLEERLLVEPETAALVHEIEVELKLGAGTESRTPVLCLEGNGSTIELYPLNI